MKSPVLPFAPAGRRTDIGLLVLRAGVGLGLATLHGWSKLSAASAYFVNGQDWPFIGAVASLGFPIPSAFASATALVESVAAVLLAIGLFTRLSAGLIAFNMSVAVYLHLKNGQSAELAALYLVSSLVVAASGAGQYSLDSLLVRSRLRTVERMQAATA